MNPIMQDIAVWLDKNASRLSELYPEVHAEIDQYNNLSPMEMTIIVLVRHIQTLERGLQ